MTLTLALQACGGLECGPGTHEADGACLPDDDSVGDGGSQDGGSDALGDGHFEGEYDLYKAEVVLTGM